MMIKYLLVTVWHTCALPSPGQPCIEAQTNFYSDVSVAVSKYIAADGALDRSLYQLEVGLFCDTMVCSEKERWRLVKLSPSK